MIQKMNLKEIRNFAERELPRLKGTIKGIQSYRAGNNQNKKGSFNFYARDLILSSILLEDLEILKNSLLLCAKLQGKKNNSYNGEEKGKIFHEYPEKKKTEKDGRNSGYNACETTSLFLIGIEYYLNKTNNLELLRKIEKNIYEAIKYLKRHIIKNLFWEDPSFSGSKEFRLKSTYWKDTGFLGRKNNKPFYPVAYTLVQAQVARSLNSASFILERLGKKDPSLNKTSKKIIKNIWKKLWDKKYQTLLVGIDKKGKIRSNSSDSLHILFYLNRNEVPLKKLKKIIKKSRELKTGYGYRGALTEKGQTDKYYSSIWPWEQGFIFLAGKKHKIKEVQKESLKSLKAIKNLNCFPEVIKYEKGKIENLRYDTQLWTIAYVIRMEKEIKKFLNEN